MCRATWQVGFLRGQEQLLVFQHQRTMGAKHIAVPWSRTLWTHMWIDHMNAYVAKWGTLRRFSFFSLEGTLVLLKRMARNMEGYFFAHNSCAPFASPCKNRAALALFIPACGLSTPKTAKL